jgi:hypothetical protein
MRDNSLKSVDYKQVLAGAGSPLAVAAAVFLLLLFLCTAFRLGFYFLYAVSVVSSAACFRCGTSERAFGITSFVALASAWVCFLLCCFLVGPEQHGPDPVGANSMTNLFELVTYPFKFLPLAAPAVACWFLAIMFEKWPVALNIVFGLLMAVLAIVNFNIGMYLVMRPDLLEWFLT